MTTRARVELKTERARDGVHCSAGRRRASVGRRRRVVLVAHVTQRKHAAARARVEPAAVDVYFARKFGNEVALADIHQPPQPPQGIRP